MVFRNIYFLAPWERGQDELLGRDPSVLLEGADGGGVDRVGYGEP